MNKGLLLSLVLAGMKLSGGEEAADFVTPLTVPDLGESWLNFAGWVTNPSIQSKP